MYEDEVVKYKKKAKHKHKQKTDHRHDYENVHIIQHIKRHNLSIEYLGSKCKICGKIRLNTMYIFNEVPDWVKDLELIEQEV